MLSRHRGSSFRGLSTTQRAFDPAPTIMRTALPVTAQTPPGAPVGQRCTLRRRTNDRHREGVPRSVVEDVDDAFSAYTGGTSDRDQRKAVRTRRSISGPSTKRCSWRSTSERSFRSRPQQRIRLRIDPASGGSEGCDSTEQAAVWVLARAKGSKAEQDRVGSLYNRRVHQFHRSPAHQCHDPASSNASPL